MTAFVFVGCHSAVIEPLSTRRGLPRSETERTGPRPQFLSVGKHYLRPRSRHVFRDRRQPSPHLRRNDHHDEGRPQPPLPATPVRPATPSSLTSSPPGTTAIQLCFGCGWWERALQVGRLLRGVERACGRVGGRVGGVAQWCGPITGLLLHVTSRSSESCFPRLMMLP